ncbi:MAG TPA: nuclear transport factor 2 family protein [Candidatus Eremiobacteraceae bacterium]|nr:nuclear transport factor 2 family protein [Candidatus Eremiobacteraceae bacterium]
MDNKEPIAAVLAFLEAINSGDANKICALITEDHVFVDALGNKVQGKEAMRKAWAGYFQWFPDYRVSHEEILSDGSLVAAFGSAEGTYALKGTLLKQNHWSAPAAWLAIVRDGLVKEWRVYADNQAARKIMGWPNP